MRESYGNSYENRGIEREKATRKKEKWMQMLGFFFFEIAVI